MLLHDFPFDRQIVKYERHCAQPRVISFSLTDILRPFHRLQLSSKWYGDEAMHFVNITEPEMIKTFSQAVTLTEWELTRDAEVAAIVRWNKEDKRDMSIVEIRFYVRRLSGYYLKNIISLLFILSVISWAMYIVPPYVLNDRLQISITLFLAQVAFNFVVVEQLPKISYGTYLSVYFIMCYALLGVGAVENVVSYLVNRYYCEQGDAQTACETALKLDLGALGVVAGIHLIVTGVYIMMGLRRKKGERHVSTVADSRTMGTPDKQEQVGPVELKTIKIE